jgi:excisionase family DNA binding protein
VNVATEPSEVAVTRRVSKPPADLSKIDRTDATTWPEIMQVSHIALVMGVGEDTIRKWFADGSLPGTQLGRTYMLRKTALLRIIEGRQDDEQS